jgi:maltose/maltodextrin transport system permease protein
MDSTSTQPSLRRYRGLAVVALLALAGLYFVTVVYIAGETLLASTMLVLVALALWTYSSAKTMALRYLFPGVAAAVVFVIFPMLYTVTIGFTNYSSSNVLDFKRARQYLLDETFRAPGPAYSFSLHAAGDKFRLRLEDQDDEQHAFVSPPLALATAVPREVKVFAAATEKTPLGDPMTMKEVIGRQAALKALTLVLPDGQRVRMTTIREFAPVQPLYKANADGTLTNTEKGTVIRPNYKTGFFETETGERLQPGFTVGIGLAHFKRIFTDAKFSEPFVRIFVWTVVFSLLSVLFAASLGLLLATLLNWEALRFKGGFRLILFLPYAVPGFISIMVFKGLFNQNLGEINAILNGLFGIKPAWFADPFLAKTMIDRQHLAWLSLHDGRVHGPDKSNSA